MKTNIYAIKENLNEFIFRRYIAFSKYPPLPEDGASKTLAGLARRGGDTGHPAWGRVEATLAGLTADARIQSIITGAGCWAGLAGVRRPREISGSRDWRPL